MPREFVKKPLLLLLEKQLKECMDIYLQKSATTILNQDESFIWPSDPGQQIATLARIKAENPDIYAQMLKELADSLNISTRSLYYFLGQPSKV